MTTGVEYVREECKRQGIAVAQLEKDLGFSNGYLNPKKLNVIPYDRAKQIAQYLRIDMHRILGDQDDVENSQQQEFYFDDETAAITFAMADNPELRALYYAQRNMDPEDIEALYNMVLALKRKSERLDQDDPC